jgi:hypothetical protein
LISKLRKEGGIDLLLFCVRAGRFTSTTQNNYRLFYEWLCEKNVPIVVASFRENESDFEPDDPLNVLVQTLPGESSIIDLLSP